MKRPPLAPAPPGRRARRHAETRARILRAAWRLFERQGFFATTVEQITEAADVGKGTFFNYFPSKEYVLAGFGEMQLGKIRAVLEDYRRAPGPIRETLGRLVVKLAEEPGRSPALVRSLLVANLSSEPVRQLWRRNLERGRRLLARLLAEGQRRGEIRSDRKPLDLARQIQQTFFGVLLFWAIHPRADLAARLEETFSLLWPALESAARREVN